MPNVSCETLKIQINVDGKKYVMHVEHGKELSTHIGTSISNCLDVAKSVIRKKNYSGKITFKVITLGYDANGAPITELVTEAYG